MIIYEIEWNYVLLCSLCFSSACIFLEMAIDDKKKELYELHPRLRKYLDLKIRLSISNFFAFRMINWVESCYRVRSTFLVYLTRSNHALYSAIYVTHYQVFMSKYIFSNQNISNVYHSLVKCVGMTMEKFKRSVLARRNLDTYLHALNKIGLQNRL